MLYALQSKLSEVYDQEKLYLTRISAKIQQLIA